jgi:hypothetical protein
MPEEWRQDIELNRFWNELTHAGSEPAVGNLDPEQAETLRRLYAMTRTPPPEVAQARVDRAVREQLVAPWDGHASSRLRETKLLASVLPASAPHGWGSPDGARLAPQAAGKRSPWAGLQLATAVLMLLILGIGYVALRAGADLVDRPVVLPAAVGTDTTLDTVFAATLPPDLVPAAGNLDFVAWRVALDPGRQAQYEGRIRGPQISHVLEGELTLRAQGPLYVFRGASGTATGAEVPPQTAVVLHAGDSAVYGLELPVEYANMGATPVQLVSGGLFAGFSGWIPEEFTLLDYNEEYALPSLPPGPVEASLVRATLPRGGEVSAPPPGALVLEVGASGDADIAQRADGSLRNIGEKTVTIYVLTLVPIGATGTAQPS